MSTTWMRSGLVAAGVALSVLAGAAVAQPVVTYTKSGAKVADVRDDLKAAIESRGFVIDYQAQIGAMLERTGRDLGAAKKIYDDAQALQFCSAKLSRQLMEADPTSVVLCPFTLVVWASADAPQQVHVAYRRPMLGRGGGGAQGSPAMRQSLRELDTLLDSLAREAVGRK